MIASIQESTCFRTGQHSDDGTLPANAEESSRWDESAGLFEDKEASELPDEGQAVWTSRWSETRKIDPHQLFGEEIILAA
jgi:hypothetical protein